MAQAVTQKAFLDNGFSVHSIDANALAALAEQLTKQPVEVTTFQGI
ncbi:hypothetical protein O9993_18610 [Vibrio lentus]|nr:hypothetical protein [Vibrio lentus]